MSRNVHINDGRSRFIQTISLGPHSLTSDEPFEGGGRDAGPNPYELLLAALGSCASITVRMYAERKQWPLEGVRVEVSWGRVHDEDCAACDSELDMAEGIEVKLSFLGDLSEQQRLRLTEIANRCPVHRTLSAPIPILTRLANV